MDIYIVLKQSKDGKVYLVCAFTRKALANKLRVNLQNSDKENTYVVKTSMFVDAM